MASRNGIVLASRNGIVWYLSMFLLFQVNAASSQSSNRHSAVTVSYSPFHHDGYPHQIQQVLDGDMAIMSQYVDVIKTYYSSYYGDWVVPHAVKYGLKVYLGVFMTRSYWGKDQIRDAIQQALTYPNAILGIYVGCENLEFNDSFEGEKFSPQEIISTMQTIRNALRANGVQIPVGTAQRITEWLDPNLQTTMKNIAANSDLLGANIYDFFSNGYTFHNPVRTLDILWNTFSFTYYDHLHKLRLTETGWPTDGSSSNVFPENIYPSNQPNWNNANRFYQALRNWQPAVGDTEICYFTFFDLNRNEIMGQRRPYEKYFGLFDSNGNSKGIIPRK